MGITTDRATFTHSCSTTSTSATVLATSSHITNAVTAAVTAARACASDGLYVSMVWRWLLPPVCARIKFPDGCDTLLQCSGCLMLRFDLLGIFAQQLYGAT